MKTSRFLPLLLILAPVLSACRGAYISYENALEIKDDIKTAINAEDFNPEINLFTRKLYEISGSTTTVKQRIFDRENMFYSDYSIINNSSVSENYTFAADNATGYLIYDMWRNNGEWSQSSIYQHFSTKEERDTYYETVVAAKVKSDVVNETKNTLTTMESVFTNYVDSETIETSVYFMSENSESLYFECAYNEDSKDSEGKTITNRVKHKYQFRNLLVTTFEKYTNEGKKVSIGYNYGKAVYNIPDVSSAPVKSGTITK